MLYDWFKKTLTTLSTNQMLSARFRALASGEKARERPKVKAFYLFYFFFSLAPFETFSYSFWSCDQSVTVLTTLKWGAPNPKRGKMWENRSWLILVFASDWSKERCEFSRPIREKTDVKPMQCVITFGVFKVCSCLTLSSDLLYNVCICIYT